MSIKELLGRSKRWREATKDPDDPQLKKELDKYYQDKNSLYERIPKDLQPPQDRYWWQSEIKKLQDQLSPKVHSIVLARQRKWQMKVQSAHS